MSAVDDYLKNVSEPYKAELERIRSIVKQAVPDAEEVISYGMPGFKLNGKYLAGYAAFKDHLSFFPTSKPVEVLHEKLEAFETSKGTLQFTSDKPLPEALIIELVHVRLEDIKGKN